MMRRADARTQISNTDDIKKAIPVEVFVVRSRDVPRIIEARGFLEGVEELSLYSEVDGRIVTRAVDDGANVRAGDLLLEVDDTFYALAVELAKGELSRSIGLLGEARAGLKQAEAEVDVARVRRANAADELERGERMRASGASPPVEYNRFKSTFDAAEAELQAAGASKARVASQLATAEATIQIAQTSLGDAVARLERCTIRSPISGRVNRFFIEPGELAMASAPLVELVRLDQMKILVELSGSDIGFVKQLARAEVTVDSARGQVFVGVLDHVAPKMDPVSRKFQVEFLVNNSEQSLLSGMYGQVRLHCGEMKDVMTIPREAVFKHFGADHCHVVVEEDGRTVARVRKLEVEPIRGRLDELRILSGLVEGERPLLSRRREISDGTLIEVGRVQNATSAVDELGDDLP